MRQSGLSLLELLVSLVLMALIAAFLSNALSLSARVDETGRAASIRMEREATAVAALRSLLELAQPPMRERSGTAFVGDTARLSFAAVLPTRLSGGGLLELEIDCDAGDGIAASWRRPPRRDNGQRDPEWAETLTIWPDASCRNIAYFGVPEQTPARSARWHEEWPVEALALPHLVRFDILETGYAARLIHIAPRNVTVLATAPTGER